MPLAFIFLGRCDFASQLKKNNQQPTPQSNGCSYMVEVVGTPLLNWCRYPAQDLGAETLMKEQGLKHVEALLAALKKMTSPVQCLDPKAAFQSWSDATQALVNSSPMNGRSQILHTQDLQSKQSKTKTGGPTAVTSRAAYPLQRHWAAQGMATTMSMPKGWNPARYNGLKARGHGQSRLCADRARWNIRSRRSAFKLQVHASE